MRADTKALISAGRAVYGSTSWQVNGSAAHSDDEDEIPTELPARTEEVIDNQAWLARRGSRATA